MKVPKYLVFKDNLISRLDSLNTATRCVGKAYEGRSFRLASIKVQKLNTIPKSVLSKLYKKSYKSLAKYLKVNEDDFVILAEVENEI